MHGNVIHLLEKARAHSSSNLTHFILIMRSNSRLEIVQKLLSYLKPTHSLSSPLSPLLPLVWSYIEVSEKLDSLEEWTLEKKENLRRLNDKIELVSSDGRIRSGSEPNPKSVSSKRTRLYSVVTPETITYSPRRRSFSAQAAETF